MPTKTRTAKPTKAIRNIPASHPQLIATLGTVTNKFSTDRSVTYPQPQIEIKMPMGFDRNSYRKINAALHTLAAKIELETPTNEMWIVQIDNNLSMVYLELNTADSNETNRAMELLNKIAKYNSGCIG